MKSSPRIWLLAGLALLGLALWHGGREAAATGKPAATREQRVRLVRPVAARAAATRVEEEREALPPTRMETAAYLKKLYARELLARELDLEQRRYGAHYWEMECDGVVAREIDRERKALVRQLAAEANVVLAEFFPNETGESVELEAFFNGDKSGPNVSGLSAASREKLEAWLVAGGEGLPGAGLFSAEEADAFARWNGAEARILRESLTGFAVNQAEFDLLVSEYRREAAEAVSMSVKGETEVSVDIPVFVGMTLGGQRAVEWRRLCGPGVDLAVRDLRRNGLPLEQAEWLAATRKEAQWALRAVRLDGALTDVSKQQKAAALEREYGQTIAARLGLPRSTIDELVPETIR